MNLTPEQAEWLQRYQTKHPPKPPAPDPTPTKPKPVYRPATDDELIAIQQLPTFRYPVGCFDKRFARQIANATQITDPQATQLWRILYRYRRQINGPNKDRALTLALQHTP